MALTRTMLRGMSLTEEQVSTIIEAHVETVNALKEERDKLNDQINALSKDSELLKKEQTKAEDLQKKVDELQKSVDESEDFKTKYETVKKEFDDYKVNVDNENTNRKKTDAYRKLLKEVGIADKHIDSVLKVCDVSSAKLKDDGSIEDVDKLKENIKEQYSEFIPKESVKGAKTETPPKNEGGKMTKEEIMKITDRNERQKAISENHELFGY